MDKDYDKEYEWFSYYISVTSVLILIVIWSVLPEDTEAGSLHRGVFKVILDVLPQRNWIIYSQCLVLMGMLYTYFGILMYNEDVLMAPLDDLRTITDSRGEVVICGSDSKMLKAYAFKESSGIIDLPIMDVCEILYSTDTVS
ncbi:phosphatidylinositol N-acetylglucosaminyltransferase GPI19 TDEL_0A04120 [Torulaspora delbrueckii]|uniref:Phosphatidylinositol N-acetylglucosaminyltransferase subunit GPI19 n=1 Tax=Torulaspora delbrueckii TaxID=4950 RepID=G8ZMA0_TORDE|nr:hypothetical protein TDEL_0A04120 [Torulaspora delbrueckii]CCE89744.1 hypothetical protein TDEL_0A04120 [Torulaspora delbrueckii]